MMKNTSFRALTWVSALIWMGTQGVWAAPLSPDPFGSREQMRSRVDDLATCNWLSRPNRGRLARARDQVIGFALYTLDAGVLKMSAQLYPLLPDEAMEVRLEVQRDGNWEELARAPVVYPGWSAHFRVDNWDSTQALPYRVRHGAAAIFEGIIRQDPTEQDEVVVASLSCNGSKDGSSRQSIVNNLRHQDPDLLFFAGDQGYEHKEHTAAWLRFGEQFKDILRDRPVITIPDDHDVGHANLWGEAGGISHKRDGSDGGYRYAPTYVKMVERQQTWHLPDAFDPTPVGQGIGVYYTRLRWGGIDFAILEDRKFKTGPLGEVDTGGQRPDHVRDAHIDVAALDKPGLVLLGERQLHFLNVWAQDWQGAQMKCVLSQTPFAMTQHLNAHVDDRLRADLDSNGWPQSGRNRAVRAIRRAWAPHLCGDQHLATVVQHGVDGASDGPYGFSSPAISNTIWGRWWWPADEQPGNRPVPGSALPWTGEYRDGLGNPLRMVAYANPGLNSRTRKVTQDVTQRGDGYALIRFRKSDRTITFECWPRYADVAAGDAQYPGWPITVKMADNDGRLPSGHLHLDLSAMPGAVVQVMDESRNEMLYTVRAQGAAFEAPVYGTGPFTLRAGQDRPDSFEKRGLMANAAVTVE